MSVPTIVCLAGIPGSGKTTLARLLGSRWGSTVLHADDFLSEEELIGKVPSPYRNGRIDFTLWRNSGLMRALDSLLSSSHVVLEDPRGMLSPDVGPRITRTFWLDIPPDLALARMLQREIMDPEWVRKWLSSFLGAYTSRIRLMNEALIRQVAPTCHHILDAREPTDSLIRTVESLMNASDHQGR